jgi:hypothetical protein
MIPPTVGRVIWFRPIGARGGEQPLSASIAHVNHDGTINIGYFSPIGQACAAVGIEIWDGESERPTGAYCEWMPYQKGQAQKTEQLEKQVADRAV